MRPRYEITFGIGSGISDWVRVFRWRESDHDPTRSYWYAAWTLYLGPFRVRLNKYHWAD